MQSEPLKRSPLARWRDLESQYLGSCSTTLTTSTSTAGAVVTIHTTRSDEDPRRTLKRGMGGGIVFLAGYLWYFTVFD